MARTKSARRATARAADKASSPRPRMPRFPRAALPRPAAQPAVPDKSDYRQFYDFAPVIWMVLDSVGIVRDISAAGSLMLGAPSKIIVGTPLRMWVDADSRSTLLEHFRICRTTDERVETDVRLGPRGSSARSTIRLHSQQSSFHGELVFPTVGIDITAQSSLERARDNAERQRDVAEADRKAARAAEAVKDRLIATVSHELRNPLSPALLAAAMLTTWPGLPEKVRSMANVIKRNIELEARLIDDLLDLARATRGQLDLRMKTIDVHEVIRHAIEACSAAATAKGLVVNLDLAAASHHVVGDAVRLEQVIWNLINNAIKFSERGGCLFVRTWSDGAGTMRVTVRDLGAGMDRDTLERLFAPFEQPRVPVGGQAGLGLGLTIARSIVELHGGAIWAESDGLGRGSVFEVELRTTTPDVPNEAAAAGLTSASTPERRMRILLVENHEDTGTMLATSLMLQGYDVTYVHSLKEAMAVIDDGFDVVLSDIGLGDGSGLDIARHFRTNGARPAHLIAVSGYGTDADREASREAGFDDHLVKPVDLDALLELIESTAPAPATA